MIPNTFSNKESIAQEDSLQNQLKNFISYPLIVWGGGGWGGRGLLITSRHYSSPLLIGLSSVVGGHVCGLKVSHPSLIRAFATALNLFSASSCKAAAVATE